MYRVETELEADGRSIAGVPELPGVLANGASRQGATVRRVQSLSLRVLADRLDHGESLPQVDNVFAVVA